MSKNKGGIPMGKNKMCRFEYFIYLAIWLVPLIIWYRKLLFKSYNGLSVFQSWMLLLGMMVAFGVLWTLSTIKRYRSNMSVMVCLLFPVGVYTAMNFISLRRELYQWVLIIAAIICAGYLCLVFFRKIENKERYSQIVLSRIRHSVVSVFSVFTVALIVVMSIMAVDKLTGNVNMYPSVKTDYNDSIAGDYFYDNIDTVVLLDEEKWSDLTVSEKRDVLQIIANVERYRLGLPDELHVELENIASKTHLGYYTDDERTITVNKNFLAISTPAQALEVICHEAYHAYEYRLVELYFSTDSSLKDLKVFEDVPTYAQEFSDYVESSEDYSGYYYQRCEVNARAYSEASADEYMNAISIYTDGFIP